MKQKIIQALAYPRRLMRGSVELQNCSHSGHFSQSDGECGDCYYGLECAWLFSNDENVSVEEKPLEALREALEHCHGYVDARTTEWGHDNTRCDCDACCWLRNADDLISRWR
ncbi:MAG: hypothetical protein QNJ87_13030 [Gammaproteobacteria bacterium]|nr:hypothetical protein [Gammaproteobacteria bacterium]MDJ0872678.1 hypothetical protein [Gammaproteobacteria bacterium]MDJ0889790.1 hypothetical protein [Gammaproteobacteria bacterium]